MATLATSPINRARLLQKFDAATTGLSYVKRLRIYNIYTKIKSRIRPNSNNLKLCSCAIPTITLDGVDYVVVTRRKARAGKTATFSSMWVFPGGHVDCGEGTARAAVRELQEETGLLSNESSLKFLCSYNAVLVSKKKGYLILFYSAPVTNSRTSVVALLKDVAVDEVSAACLVPAAFLPHLSPRKITGGEHQVVDGAFEGVEVRADGSVVGKTFDAMEIVGDGGEGDGGGGGLGMGHRFASAVFSNSLPS